MSGEDSRRSRCLLLDGTPVSGGERCQGWCRAGSIRPGQSDPREPATTGRRRSRPPRRGRGLMRPQANSSCASRRHLLAAAELLGGLTKGYRPGSGSSAGFTPAAIREPSRVSWHRPPGNGLSGFGSTHGARLIDSTPPSPRCRPRRGPLPGNRRSRHPGSTAQPVRPSSRHHACRPASRPAIRATLRLSSPAPLALPSTSRRPGSGRAGGRFHRQCPHHVRRQVVGTHACQRTPVLPERGPYGVVQVHLGGDRSAFLSSCRGCGGRQDDVEAHA